MTDRESLDLHFGRWLLWGLLAVVALMVVVIFFANLGKQSSPPAEVGEQVEWSIQASEYTPSPGLVTLKGDIPLGFPTETWKDGVMLARSVDASQFEWNMNASPEVPIPVYEIDQDAGSCNALNDHLNNWGTETAQAPGDAQRTQAEAFAQHALDTMLAEGCEPSVNS